MPRQLLLVLCCSLLGNVSAAEPADRLAGKLFTAATAERLLAGPVTPGIRNSQPDVKNGATTVSQCSYSLKCDATSPVIVSLLVRCAGTADEAKAIFLSSKNIFNGQTVAGIGDDAYRTPTPAQLNILKGCNWLIISAGAFPKSDAGLQERTAREILKNFETEPR